MNEHDFWTHQQALLHQETTLHHGGRPPVEIEPMYPERRRLDPSRSGCHCGQGWNWNRWWADGIIGGLAGVLVLLSAGTYLWRDFIQADALLSRAQGTLMMDLATTQATLSTMRRSWTAASLQLNRVEPLLLSLDRRVAALEAVTGEQLPDILTQLQVIEARLDLIEPATPALRSPAK